MRRSLLIPALLLSFIAAAQVAAQSPTKSSLPWSGYDSVEIVAADFSSIIGDGGVLLPESNDVGPEGRVFTLNFNAFEIGFLTQVYTPPVKLAISSNGWISFNGSASDASSPVPELRYTVATSRPHFNKVLMAYWAEIMTRDVDQGGIYWKVDSAVITENGATGMRRYLVIEWNARYSDDAGAAPGRFQARIYQRGAGLLNSRIELLYGPQSIDLPQPTEQEIHYGAQVGIKNFGQVQGNPLIVGDSIDREKFLIACNPAQFVSMPGGNAITRLRTMQVPDAMNVLVPHTPEWWASYSRYAPGGMMASRYYHYSFPPPGGNGSRPAYRMKPVTIDMGAAGIVMNGLGPDVPNVFGPGTEVQPAGSFINLGGLQVFNVPFTLVIQQVLPSGGLDPIPEYSFAGRIDSLSPGASTRVPGFNPRGHFFQKPGMYRATLCVQLPGDANPFNDCTTLDVVISPAADIAARRVVAPAPNRPPSNTTYNVGETVPLIASFMNNGLRPSRAQEVGYRVLDETLVLVDSGRATLGGLDPLDSASVVFLTNWTPNRPGRYYFQAFVLGSDDIPANDTVPAWPGLPFDVRYPVDLALADSASGEPLKPAPSMKCYPLRPLPVAVSIHNLGGVTVRGAEIVVRATDAAGTEFHRTTTTLDVIEPGSTVLHFSKTILAPGAGTYFVTAFVQTPNDNQRRNDTIRWSFCVESTGGVEDPVPAGAFMLSAAPNPARDAAAIGYTAPIGTRIRVTAVDLLGRPAATMYSGTSEGAGEIRLGTDRLAAGMYLIRLEAGGKVVATTRLGVVR